MKKFLLLALVALSGLTSNLVCAINYAAASNSAAIQNDINNLLLAYNGQNISDPNCFANQASSLAKKIDLNHKTSPLNTALLSMYNSTAWLGVNNALSALYVNIININNITQASATSLITNAKALLALVNNLVQAPNPNNYSEPSKLLQYAQQIVGYANQLQADLSAATPVVTPPSNNNPPVVPSSVSSAQIAALTQAISTNFTAFSNALNSMEANGFFSAKMWISTVENLSVINTILNGSSGNLTAAQIYNAANATVPSWSTSYGPTTDNPVAINYAIYNIGNLTASNELQALTSYGPSQVQSAITACNNMVAALTQYRNAAGIAA